jgi:carbon-monoxide dehydrogenase catalytic subunit
MRVLGSENLTKLLTEEMEQITGGKFCYESDPVEAAHRMIDHIDKKRKALSLKPLMFDVPYKPK